MQPFGNSVAESSSQWNKSKEMHEIDTKSKSV